MKNSTLSTMIFLILIIVFTLSVKPATAESPIIGKNSDDTVEIQVHSFNTATSLEYHPFTPYFEGYIFAYVDLTITNIGTEEVNTNIIHAFLKDSQNHQYKGEIVLAPQGITVVHLSPGEALRGEVYWEIPSDAEITSFIWDDGPIYIKIPAPSPTPTPTPTESPDIPEFPFIAVIALIVIVVTVAVILIKRKR